VEATNYLNSLFFSNVGFVGIESQQNLSFFLNYMIHHRAITCVYLRLNNVPVPGMYGPSGDE